MMTFLIILGCIALSIPLGIANWVMMRYFEGGYEYQYQGFLPEKIMLGELLIAMLSAILFPIMIILVTGKAIMTIKTWNITVWRSKRLRDSDKKEKKIKLINFIYKLILRW